MTVRLDLPAPGPHGGDGGRLAQTLGIPVEDVLDLSASLNPVAPDPAPVLARYLPGLNRYPDATEATAALAEVMAVDPERLVLTNGGAEAIALVAAELGEGWVDEPDFSLYRRHLPVVRRGAGVWRSNPHNPMGRLAPPGAVAAVWDEAFWPLATGTWTRGDAERGSIVVGSLTKLLACPGLRIGYVLCPDPDTARRVRARQPEWAVNGLVATALPELLATVDLPGWANATAELRDRLVTILTAAGYEPDAGVANWVLVAAPDLRARLAGRAICIRDCTSFGLPGTVRIAVPDPSGLERLAAAL